MSLYRSKYAFSGLIAGLFRTYVAVYARPRVIGARNLPKKGPFIIASNHVSHADTAVLFNAVPRKIRQRTLAAAAQDYFFKGDIRTWSSRIFFNAIPVSRELNRGTDPLKHVVRALREGYGVLLYPEGTRSKNGEIGPFRGGIGRLAAEFPGLPIIPTYVSGTNRIMPKGKFVPRPYRATIIFGEPLYLEARLHQRSSWQRVARRVRHEVVKLSGKLPPPLPEERVQPDPIPGKSESTMDRLRHMLDRNPREDEPPAGDDSGEKPESTMDRLRHMLDRHPRQEESTTEAAPESVSDEPPREGSG